MSKSKDLIFQIIQEAKNYDRLEDIEKLVEQSGTLAVVPIQPLYVALASTSSDQVAEVLPRLSKTQRQAMLDIDLWHKDEVDYLSFDFWIESYSKVKESEVIEDFVSAEDFALYLRGRVNLYTFDVEDPMYPDHDYYFLTDDTLLLIEYGEDYPNPNELKFLIRSLYDKLGVEKAYSHLFKIVNDSFFELEEKQYQEKKERLRDYGFVDYYDALEQLIEFKTYPSMDRYIQEKKAQTAEIAAESRNQSLHHAAVIGFSNHEDIVREELQKIDDDKRFSYLHFTFVRLVNSSITLNDALKGGRIELNRVSKKTRMLLNLGAEYLRSKGEEKLFIRFDFFDLYRIGKTLLVLEKRRLKKQLAKFGFDREEKENFLGSWWNGILENAYDDYPKAKNFGASLHAKEVDSLPVYYFWKNQLRSLADALPYIDKFYQTLSTMKAEGKLHDDFYLNYNTEEIDFEAIIISSFIGSVLKNAIELTGPKMGITIPELKLFLGKLFLRNNEEYFLKAIQDSEVQTELKSFVDSYGLAEIHEFEQYLYGILTEHLSGYDFDSLNEEDFKHIGGPIFFNTLNKN
tara:strand:+ start:5514 stop:7229 length:1716 start_codon:yes stop_codon:yes gene_type:complete